MFWASTCRHLSVSLFAQPYRPCSAESHSSTFTDHKSSLHYCMMTRVKVVKGQGTVGIVCRGVAGSTAS